MSVKYIVFIFITTPVLLVLLSSTSSPGGAASQPHPPVHWTPDAVNAIIAPGERTDVQVSLDAVQALGSVDLRVVPEIAPYVSVSPSSLTNVQAGNQVTIHITVQAAANASLGLLDGTIQVRQHTTKPGQGKVFPRPLPVHVLIRKAEELPGADADGNGVWDYVDQYINGKYPAPADSNLRVALRQNARALEGGMLHADDKSLSLRYAEDSNRAVECLYFVRPNDAHDIRAALEAVILNNKTRSTAFLMWNGQLAGQVFRSTPLAQLSTACVPE